MSPKLPERVFSRRLTPDEVILLSHGQHILHLRDDEVVRTIRRCSLGVIGKGMCKEARDAAP